MAEDFVELGFEAASPLIQNYDKVTDPMIAKAKQLPNPIKNRRGQDRGNDDDYYEYDRYEGARRSSGRDRGRDDAYYDDEYERRGSGRAKSAGRDGYGGRGLRDDRRRRESRRSYSSDSSASISPRRAYKHRKSLGEQALGALGLGGILGAEEEKKRERRRDSDRYRGDGRDRGFDDSKRMPAGYLGYNERDGYSQSGSNAGAVAKRNGYNDNASAVTKRTGDYNNHRGEKRKSSSESSSESSSDVCSSSEDERRVKKMKGKEFLTAGLAAVATIHAAHGVYSSMEARDKRHADVAKGEMTPEEASKLKRKAHLQDAAAIGIAALGIKGAYSEWQEVQEHRKELATEKQERQKRHEKRVKKASKHGGSSYGNGRNDGRYRSEPDLNRGYRDRDYSR
ncbi:MAG: hypothetical protein Q9220_006310 [cf. Caloplaca sp. 1 TL-2023]